MVDLFWFGWMLLAAVALGAILGYGLGVIAGATRLYIRFQENLEKEVNEAWRGAIQDLDLKKGKIESLIRECVAHEVSKQLREPDLRTR